MTSKTCVPQNRAATARAQTITLPFANGERPPEEVRPDADGLWAGAFESSAFTRHLRRSGRSREAGTGMEVYCFLIQIGNVS